MIPEPLFLSPLPLHLSVPCSLPSTGLRNRVPQAIAHPRLPPYKQLFSPPNLAQAARIVMSVFQLTTFVTPALINPLYTPHILTTLPSNFPVIQALGLTNLSTSLTFHAYRTSARPCRLSNAFIFAATAAIYLIIPIKPPHVNIPFTATLAFISLTNALSLPVAETNQKPTTSSLPPLAKLLVAAATLFPALQNHDPLERVYILQIALNLAAAAAVALQSRSHHINRFLFLADASLLLAAATCLSRNGLTKSALMLAFAAFSFAPLVLYPSKNQSGS